MNDRPPSDLASRLREAAQALPPSPGADGGRGIVICAGGARLFTCAWLMIAMLRRRFACRLPIEVWHIGPAEIGPPMRALLEAFDVRVIDALKVARRFPVETLGGWQLKTYALLHSDFREILLLDADNLPVKDPTFLFDEPCYRDSGALFWPDIVRLKASNPIWAISGLSIDPGPSFETGQILLDRTRHWRALLLAHWINQNHVAFEDMLYGDKDAFYVAWRLVGEEYHLIGRAPKLLDHTFCQRDPNGGLLFQHRNGAKWLIHGANPRIEGFRFEDECFALLSELRLLWDGTIFNPPDRSDDAKALERSLVDMRGKLIWFGSHEHEIALAADHLIEGGGAEAERYWHVADGSDGLELRLTARGALSCALRCDGDGIWRATAGGFVVEMHPMGETPIAVSTGMDMLAMIDRLLESGDGRAHDPDVLVTLATLSAFDDHVRAHLERRAAGRSGTSLLAQAALARTVTALSASAPIRPGTGWQARSGNLGVQTEAVPRR